MFFCQCFLIGPCHSGANPQPILAPWGGVGPPNWLNLGQGRGQPEAQKSTESGGDYDFWAVRGDVRSFGVNTKLGPGTFKNDGARTGLWAGVCIGFGFQDRFNLGQGKGQLEAQKGRKQVGISIFGVSGHESAFCQCLLISRCPSGANPQLILAS